MRFDGGSYKQNRECVGDAVGGGTLVQYPVNDLNHKWEKKSMNQEKYAGTLNDSRARIFTPLFVNVNDRY